ncbi:hypothetical protein [Methyloceanibacter sp.]|jgi:hypothetical protein|uniref:hypothetical protein n=1 Tax=Methyloceanibacter sp. TaxID=1965321 RepID=UPI002BF136D3|nr:hypothetical protein [Methyloceanibacter sp.]
MSRIQILMLLGALLLAEMAHAEPVEPVEQAAQAKCQVAEVNPVTGHVFCIKPQGAPVEPPPEDIAPPCNAEASRGQWSWEPTCKPAPKG